MCSDLRVCTRSSISHFYHVMRPAGSIQISTSMVSLPLYGTDIFRWSTSGLLAPQLSLSCICPHMHACPPLAAPNEAVAFNTLMKELYRRAKAQSPPLLVTAAMRASPLALKHYELSQVHKYLDTIFLMSYDYNGALGNK